jgi:hypothetical protein
MYMISVTMYIPGGSMAAPASLRHKHLRIDQAKLDKAKKVLAAATDTETLDRALTLVVSEANVDAALRRVAGKGKLKKLFP